MKRFLLSAAAILIVSPAVAADLGRPITKAPPMVAPASSWTGCYIGGNGGFGWGEEKRSSDTATFWFTPVPNSDKVKPDGGVGGGQIGCNWEMPSRWVFGLEFMGQGADLHESKTSVFYPASDVWTTNISAILAVTGRIGYDAGGWMPYVKGGVAFVNMRSRFQDNVNDRFVQEREWYTGGLVGGGIEVMLNRNWTVGAEFNHIFADGKTFNSTRFVTSTGASTGLIDVWSNSLNVSTVIGRLNYKFDWGPVVARY
jgi:outer membrane immunogenic protein